jgi:hypothetical protein
MPSSAGGRRGIAGVISLVLALVGAALPGGGCAQQEYVETGLPVPAGGWNTAIGLDIENFNGTVSVRVDPSVAEPVVVTSIYTSFSMTADENETAVAATKAGTTSEQQDGRAVLHVKSETSWRDPHQVWVNIDVTTPRCDGLRVFNRGGKVDISGISGAVLVDNGEFGDERGPIELRTGKPMTEPVALMTTSGSVFYQVPAGSTGRFDIQSADREPELDCSIQRMAEVHAESRAITAMVGNGENPVQLRSGHGRVRAFVMEHAGEYTNKFR